MPKSTTDLVDKIDEAERDLAWAQANYLQAAGWSRNCAAPGSIWLWAKKIGDIVYAVPLDVAISMQRSLDVA